jgi:two-component system osmolarity sensor histidine kinase EnvZ
MKWLPASLAVRTVLLIIAAIIVAEVATFELVGHFRRTAHMSRTVQLLVGQVHLLQMVLPELNNEARNRLFSADSRFPDLQLRPDGAGVPPNEPQLGFARHLANELAAQLGEPVTLRHAGPGSRSGLWIGFTAGGESWWLVLPPRRLEPQELPPELWIGLLLPLAILLFIAWFFVRSIVGPLARLGEAVAATGDGAARRVTPEGPKEVRQLAERHNVMLDQLAEAEAERREMLAGLTHDLRAPLARLRIRLALLESENERIGLTRDADDMERIVTQCLAFLRSDQSCVEAPPLHLAEALRNEVGRHSELGRPVTLSIGAEAAASSVAIPPGHLQRLLDNLLDNALQYGAPPVEVTLSGVDQSAVILCVRDHGPGIAPTDRVRALEAFAQIEPARATGGSCGLGLAIVRRIASACGGTVTLEDAAGGGLQVLVRLPVVG